MKITKALIPAAGLGTRFLPITKSVPKEMLPILNLPALHYCIQEGIDAGINAYTLIVNEEKKSIVQDYFSADPHLDELLKKRDKLSVLKELDTLITQCTFSYVIQQHPLGLGHAILCARESMGNSFFGVFLPDDIIFHPTYPAIGQLAQAAQSLNATIIAVQEVPKDAVSSYGIVAPKEQMNERTWRIDNVVEKPSVHEAPSQLAIIGRYIFSPLLFEYLAKTKPGKGNEVQLTDAIQAMISDNHPVFAYKFDGTRFDLGTPSGWLEANMFFANQRKIL